MSFKEKYLTIRKLQTCSFLGLISECHQMNSDGICLAFVIVGKDGPSESTAVGQGADPQYWSLNNGPNNSYQINVTKSFDYNSKYFSVWSVVTFKCFTVNAFMYFLSM